MKDHTLLTCIREMSLFGFVCVINIPVLHNANYRHFLNELPRDKTNKMAVRPAKTNQPGHPPSLISLRSPHEESLGP